MTTDQAAFAALREIFKVETFGPKAENAYDPPSDKAAAADYRPQAVVEEIRQFWLGASQYRRERKRGSQFSLTTSKASPAQWLDVARAIVEPVPQPDDERGETQESDDDAPGRRRPLSGEPLRGKRSPSVGELMAKRADAIDNTDTYSSLSSKMYSVRVLHDELLWQNMGRQGGGAVDLSAISANGPKARKGEKVGRATKNAIAKFPLVLLADAGIGAGDDSVTRDYATWVRSRPEYALDYEQAVLFLPVWRHPENLTLAELARWAFISDDSFLSPQHDRVQAWPGGWVSPLLAVPAFRQLIKRELADSTVIGTVNIDFNKQMSIKHTGGGGSLYNCPVYMPDADVPQHVSVPLRRCDACAWELTQIDGVPRFEFYWPAKRRDAARAEIGKFFDRWGSANHEKGFTPNVSFLSLVESEFRLPRLAQPATANDVAAGRAIFSLLGASNAQVRVVPLKPFPHIARWKTLKAFRLLESVPMSPGNAATDLSVAQINALPRENFDREGRIWQAEEMLVDGKWHRYYGFVGNHIVAKVPADEIELLEDFEVQINRR